MVENLLCSIITETLYFSMVTDTGLPYMYRLPNVSESNEIRLEIKNAFSEFTLFDAEHCSNRLVGIAWGLSTIRTQK